MATCVKESTSPNEITLYQQMMSSCCGATVCSFFIQPFDVVKTRLQAQHKPLLVPAQEFLDIGKPQHKTELRMNGSIDAVYKIVRYQGFTTLFSGLQPTLVMAVPSTVIYFTAYEYIKHWFGYPHKTNNHAIPMAAGALARVGAVIAVSPMELLRTKMQSEKLTNMELWRSLKGSVSHGGIGFLWRGFVPTVLRDVPFSAMYWYGYEFLKQYEMKLLKLEEPTVLVSFSSGALAGTFAAFVTLPFDVIKTHRQMELGDLRVLEEEKTKKSGSSTWGLLRKVFRQSGIRGLFSGLTPRLLKIAPACAIMISSYEYGKTFFRSYNRKHAAA